MQNYIINVFGAMTTGKSTLVENLQKHIDRIYTVDYDVIKRQIAGFYSKRDRAIATQLTYDTLRAVAKTELSIIALLPPPENEATYEQVKNLDRKVINIELVAPLDVLIERYQQRLSALKNSGKDVSKLRSIEEFKTTVQADYFKPRGTYRFDSSNQTAEEIFEAVKAIL